MFRAYVKGLEVTKWLLITLRGSELVGGLVASNMMLRPGSSGVVSGEDMVAQSVLATWQLGGEGGRRAYLLGSQGARLRGRWRCTPASRHLGCASRAGRTRAGVGPAGTRSAVPPSRGLPGCCTPRAAAAPCSTSPTRPKSKGAVSGAATQPTVPAPVTIHQTA